MGLQYYSFEMGQIAFTALLDGATRIGAEGVLKRFPDADADTYRQAFAAMDLSLDDAESSLNILLARIGRETVLIDGGQGGRPRGGDLLKNMAAAGIAPERVTQVVITHSHGDHVLGLISDAGTPNFPNAAYTISRREMEVWRERVQTGTPDQTPLLAMLEARGLRLIQMDESILPGLRAVPAPGHTPGQIGLRFESEGKALFHLADMLHSPMQFLHPEWSPSFDADTSTSVPTRRGLLARVAEENALAFFYHLPFPGLGRIRLAESGFAWEPVSAG